VTTVTITKARQLMDCDANFRAMIEVWKEQKQCPLPIADLLLEYGLVSQSEAALWAATTEKRSQYDSAAPEHPYPIVYGYMMKTYYRWGASQGDDDCFYMAHHAPSRRLSPSEDMGFLSNRLSPTLTDALIDLLDYWKSEDSQ
jgi:hypothetical protein